MSAPRRRPRRARSAAASSPTDSSAGSCGVESTSPSAASSAPWASTSAACAPVIQKRIMPVSVTVSGTPARAWRRNSSEALPALASTLTSRTAQRCAAALARRVGGELLHEALRAPVEARGERRLVGRGHDDGAHARGLGGAQHVPAALEVRVDELLRVGLGPVDVLVGGEVEDRVGPGARDRVGEPAAVADVAEHVLAGLELRARPRAPVGGQRGLVGVQQRHLLGPEAEQQRREAAADPAAAAGDQDAPAAEALLQLEHGGHGVAAADDRLPVERVDREPARAGAEAPAREPPARARRRGSPPSCPPSCAGSGSLISATM